MVRRNKSAQNAHVKLCR